MGGLTSAYAARARQLAQRYCRPATDLVWEIGEVVHHDLPVYAQKWHPNRSKGELNLAGTDGSVPFRPLSNEALSRVRPVITARDVTDYGNVDFVADPFLVRSASDRWHMFFEVCNRDRTPRAVIGHARKRDETDAWTYDQVVLRADVHLSFPYVFEWNGTHYMIPDRWTDSPGSDVLLYRCRSFPHDWECVGPIIRSDDPLFDCVVFRYEDRWWAISGDDASGNVYIHHSGSLTGEWHPHVQNPVVERREMAARPGGRPVVTDTGIVLFFQDCAARYGDKLRAYAVSTLTEDEYADRPVFEAPLLRGSGDRLGWNSGNMHHLDAHSTGDGWRCATDGEIGFGRSVFGSHWAIGVFDC